MVLGAGPASPVSGCPGEARAARRGRGAAAGLRAARLPRRRCSGRAAGRAAPGPPQAAPLLRARRGARARGEAGRRERERDGPGPRPSSQAARAGQRLCRARTRPRSRPPRGQLLAALSSRKPSAGPRSPARRDRDKRSSGAGGPTPDRPGSQARPGALTVRGSEAPGRHLPAAAPQWSAAAASLEAVTGAEDRGGRTSWKDQHSRGLDPRPGSAGV